MLKIGIIVPEDLLETAKQAADAFEDEIIILQGSMAEGINIAKQLEEDNYDIIITRGGTQAILTQANINIPILSIPITPVDIYEAVSEAEKINGDISIIVSQNIVPVINSYLEISGKELKVFQVKEEIEVEQKIKELSKEGKKVIVGLGTAVKYASYYGLTSVVIKSGKESFIATIKEAKRIISVSKKERKEKERINAIIEHSFDSIICIDREGYITVFNSSAQKLFKCQNTKIVGKKIDTILPELQLTETLCNKITETKIVKSLKGIRVMIYKIPILVDGEVVNAVAIIKDVDEIQKEDEKIRQDVCITGHYAKYNFTDVLGCSMAIKEIIRVGKEYAKVNSTVLIEGETGTGKEIIAQSIHNSSARADKPFVAVNCAALPESLLESELFGYAAGAFTGADRKGKIGLFEQAHKGTIFLDEISEINPLLQGRLLRVLQEKQVMRIGDSKLTPVDLRVIAATNRDLNSLVGSGKFRKDLYFRLNVLRLELIPLRDRREDIPCLINYFIKYYCDRLGKRMVFFTLEATNNLAKYDWPGNVREVRNICERLTVVAKKERVTLKDLNEFIFNNKINLSDKNKSGDASPVDSKSSRNLLDWRYVEERNIRLAIELSNGNIADTAEKLGISRTTLWRKMKNYNINVTR